jgi:oxygen-independent coproporphyrinogen-3 oxidase
MGYTASKTQLMIGLGVSSISDSWYAFAQNEKELEAYYDRLEQNELPVFRGHVLTNEDLIIRKHILNLMCQFETSWIEDDFFTNVIATEIINRMEELKKDGLIEIGNNKLLVTEKGKPFVRNICMAFDLRLKRNAPKTQLFSMTV